MGKKCNLCNNEFPNQKEIDGKLRNFQHRKYCLDCSPFGSGNRQKLITLDPVEQKQNKKQKDKEKFRKYQRKTRTARKNKLVDAFGGCCVECGYKKCVAAISFHHKNPEEKKFSISEKGLLKRWDDLLEEAKKCDLLCMNCHAEKHYKMIHGD